MKKIVILLCIIALLFVTNVSYADTALKKLGRGVCNIFTSPIEIVHRMGESNVESGPLAAFTWGILDGMLRMGLRAVVGAYEVVTFPIPFPRYYEPIIDDPEFFFDEGIF